ncbi:MAG: hypothetical protein V4629_07230 [Pseudomonadota bacterium]
MWHSFEHFINKTEQLDFFIDKKYNNEWLIDVNHKIEKLKENNLSILNKESVHAVRNLEFMIKKILKLTEKNY